MVAPALLTEYLMTVLLTRLSPRILVVYSTGFGVPGLLRGFLEWFTLLHLVMGFTPRIFNVVYFSTL
jgi:hypothetical protein